MYHAYIIRSKTDRTQNTEEIASKILARRESRVFPFNRAVHEETGQWRNAHERPHLQALSPLDRWQDLWRDQPQFRGRRRGLRTRGPPPAVPSGRGDL